MANNVMSNEAFERKQAADRLMEARMRLQDGTAKRVSQADRLAFAATDNDYLEVQTDNCGETGADLEFLFEYGLWVTGTTCPDRIEWFLEGVDFDLVDVTEGNFEVSREEKTTSGAMAETTSGSVTHTRTWAILPKMSSRLWQKMLDIQMRNSVIKPVGSLYQKYSDGGAHMRLSQVSADGTFGIRSIALNVKVATWPDVMFTDTKSTDASFDMETLVEFGEVFEMFGPIPASFGKPTSMEEISITHGTTTPTNETITIEQVELVDPELYAYNEMVKVQVVDENGAAEVFTVESGQDLEIPADDYAGTTVTILFGYYAMEDFVYYIVSEEVEVPEGASFTEAVGTITIDSQTATSVTGSYTLTLNSAADGDIILSIFDTDTETPVAGYPVAAIAGGGAGTVSGLTADTDYTITLSNTETGAVIATEAFTTPAA